MSVINRRPNAIAIEALEVESSSSILELGCGPGRAIKVMASMAPDGKIFGVDLSEVMLQQAGAINRSAIEDGRVVLHQGDFEKIPLPDESIDRILAVNVVYFWFNSRTIVGEMRRVLRCGGLISIYATDASTMRHWKFAGPDTHRSVSAADLYRLLTDGGMRDDTVRIRSVKAGPGVRGLIAVVRKHGESSSS